MINCNLIPNGYDNSITVECYYSNVTYSGNISPIVKKVAELIVGNTTGMEAIKKIATWISKNTKHEKKAGFYQSPETTLLRLTGNCCCRTNLFLQMCDAMNLMENHTFYYVHVGTLKFGQRHFFALIDNFFVDVGLKDPWENAQINNKTILNITPYPILPIPKEY